MLSCLGADCYASPAAGNAQRFIAQSLTAIKLHTDAVSLGSVMMRNNLLNGSFTLRLCHPGQLV
jgi:hypothetical protein